MISHRHTLSVLVENKPGVLARVSGLFARRAFNIHSLAVGPTDDPELSRITLMVDTNEESFDQLTKQRADLEASLSFLGVIARK